MDEHISKARIFLDETPGDVIPAEDHHRFLTWCAMKAQAHAMISIAGTLTEISEELQRIRSRLP